MDHCMGWVEVKPLPWKTTRNERPWAYLTYLPIGGLLASAGINEAHNMKRGIHVFPFHMVNISCCFFSSSPSSFSYFFSFPFSSSSSSTLFSSCSCCSSPYLSPSTTVTIDVSLSTLPSDALFDVPCLMCQVWRVKIYSRISALTRISPHFLGHCVYASLHWQKMFTTLVLL